MASLKKRLELFCKSCTYDHTQSGSWRSQVEACTVKSCVWWEVRPVTMETMLRNRKEKGDNKLDLDALVDNMEDDDEPVMVIA